MGIRTSRSHTRAPFAALTAVAVAATVGAGAAGAAGPSAKAARSLSLSDSASLHESNHKGVELKEAGTAKGNLPGSIYIQLRIVGHSVTASIQLYPSGGSVAGRASASYHIVSSSTATFSGSMSITGGSGRYAKAKGSRLSFSGSVHRPGNSVSVRVSGAMTY